MNANFNLGVTSNPSLTPVEQSESRTEGLPAVAKEEKVGAELENPVAKNNPSHVPTQQQQGVENRVNGPPKNPVVIGQYVSEGQNISNTTQEVFKHIEVLGKGDYKEASLVNRVSQENPDKVLKPCVHSLYQKQVADVNELHTMNIEDLAKQGGQLIKDIKEIAGVEGYAEFEEAKKGLEQEIKNLENEINSDKDSIEKYKKEFSPKILERKNQSLANKEKLLADKNKLMEKLDQNIEMKERFVEKRRLYGKLELTSEILVTKMLREKKDSAKGDKTVTAELASILVGRPLKIINPETKQVTFGFQSKYCDAGRVQDMLGEISKRENRPLQVKIALNMLRAVDNLHNLGIIHLDLKLDNFFMQQSGQELEVFLGDFGKSRLTSWEVCSGGTFFGSHTPTEGRGTEKHDSYSMGVILFQIFSRDKLTIPKSGSSFEEWKNANKAAFNEIPKDIQNIIKGLLNPNVEQRMTISEAKKLMSEATINEAKEPVSVENNLGNIPGETKSSYFEW